MRILSTCWEQTTTPYNLNDRALHLRPQTPAPSGSGLPLRVPVIARHQHVLPLRNRLPVEDCLSWNRHRWRRERRPDGHLRHRLRPDAIGPPDICRRHHPGQSPRGSDRDRLHSSCFSAPFLAGRRPRQVIDRYHEILSASASDRHSASQSTRPDNAGGRASLHPELLSQLHPPMAIRRTHRLFGLLGHRIRKRRGIFGRSSYRSCLDS